MSLTRALDNVLIEQAHDALENGTPVRITADIRNVNRTVGTMLGYEITRRYGEDGLPDNTIDLTLNGTGGQSIGASFRVARRFASSGETNDYAGKGLSGGRMGDQADRRDHLRSAYECDRR